MHCGPESSHSVERACCQNDAMKCVGSMNIMPNTNVLATKYPTVHRFNIITAPISQMTGAHGAANNRGDFSRRRT
jgi:hypothetical protein